jgi:hypothetical protein
LSGHHHATVAFDGKSNSDTAMASSPAGGFLFSSRGAAG